MEQTELRTIAGFYQCGTCGKTIGGETVQAVFETWGDSWRIKEFRCLAHIQERAPIKERLVSFDELVIRYAALRVTLDALDYQNELLRIERDDALLELARLRQEQLMDYVFAKRREPHASQ